MTPPTTLDIQRLIACALEDVHVVLAAARTPKFEEYQRELIELLEMVQGPTRPFTEGEIRHYQEIAAASAEERHSIRPRALAGPPGRSVEQEQARRRAQSLPGGNWNAELASSAVPATQNRSNCEHNFVRVSLVNRPEEHHACDLCRKPLSSAMMQCLKCPMRACEDCERISV